MSVNVLPMLSSGSFMLLGLRLKGMYILNVDRYYQITLQQSQSHTSLYLHQQWMSVLSSILNPICGKLIVDLFFFLAVPATCRILGQGNQTSTAVVTGSLTCCTTTEILIVEFLVYL